MTEENPPDTGYDPDRQQTRARQHRREQADREWRLHPIKRYQQARSNEITESDLKTRVKHIQNFENFLLDEIAPRYDGPYEFNGIRDAVEGDVERYIETCLKPNEDINAGTIDDKLGHIKEFFKKLEGKKAIAGNPVREPLKEFRSNHNRDVERPYIPFTRMQHFLDWLDLPFSRAAWMLPLKTGIRMGEQVNIDLRCCHIDHPVFWKIVEQHDVTLDPRIRNKPDTILIYGAFTEGTEIPNEDTPGFDGDGEVRDQGNKRIQEDGSIIPIDSELKTALIELLLTRMPTYHLNVHPLFVVGGSKPRRISTGGMESRLWSKNSFTDSIRHFSAEESLDECPDCGGPVIEENLEAGEKTGRRYQCVKCGEIHWRSIHWDTGLETEQKVTHHQCRHYFSSAHSPENSGLHDGVIPDSIRKKEIRGDSNQQGDTEEQVYIEGQYKDFDDDVREPYLDGIYKFGVYSEVIPAVGEGWDKR